MSLRNEGSELDNPEIDSETLNYSNLAIKAVGNIVEISS